MMLQDLAVMLLISGFTVFAFHRLNQPKVVGYVLAGVIVGPHFPPFSFIHDQAAIATLGDIGLIFLMFSLGLDFNLRRLHKAGATAIITALLDVCIMVWLGYLLGRAVGWSPVNSLFLGAIVCDSSSSILAKILQETGRTKEPFAGIMIATTLIEDLLTVALFAVLTGVALTGSVQADMLASSLWTLALFLVVVTVAGLLIVPRLLDYIGRCRNDELLIVTLVGLCFGISLLAVRLDLSLALGAVLIGAIASESRALPRVKHLMNPLRHVFSAVFFVTIGLRVDPSAWIQHFPLLLAVTALVLGGKFLNNNIGVLLTGHNLETSLRVGAGMAQVGEFAFIIAALALSLDANGNTVYQIGIGVAVITTLLNPYILKGGDRAAKQVNASPLGRRWAAAITLYGQWVRQPERKQTGTVRRIVRRALFMITINLVLIAGIFGAGAYADKLLMEHETSWLVGPGFSAVLVWLACAFCSLPLYVVTFRKIGALSMMLAEASLPHSLSSNWVYPMRSLVASIINMAGLIMLILMTAILSSTMLPTREIFALLTAAALFFTFWAHHRMSRIYARAQSALEKLLAGSDTEGGEAAHPASPLTELSEGMGIECIELHTESAATQGHTLRSLDLRKRSGATLIAYERQGQRVTNPDPDQALAPHDQLFLLGTKKQIKAASELLASPERYS